MTLSPTQAAMRAAALQHPQHLVAPPGLPAAPRDAVRKSLLAGRLIEPAELDAPEEGTMWIVDGVGVHYRISETGRGTVARSPDADTGAGGPARAAQADAAPQAYGIDPAADPAREPPQRVPEGLPVAPAGRGVRAAAEAVLAAWDGTATREQHLPDAIAALRTALAGGPARPPSDPAVPHQPRPGTKGAVVLALLRRPEGATIAQVVEATGWQSHTVRGFLAGLKTRQGIAVEVLERVRQVGPDKRGAKGSYSIYRIAGAV